MRKSFLSSVMLIAASLAATPPAVANDFDAVSITVETGDLDLSKPSDVARLNSRLGRAASAVCADGSGNGSAGRNAFNLCKTDALSAARAQVATTIASRSADGGTLVAARR